MFHLGGQVIHGTQEVKQPVIQCRHTPWRLHHSHSMCWLWVKLPVIMEAHGTEAYDEQSNCFLFHRQIVHKNCALITSNMTATYIHVYAYM